MRRRAPRLRSLPASDSIYVCAASKTNPEVAPEGCENLFVLVPAPADPEIGCGDAFGEAQSPLVGQIADHAVRLVAKKLGEPDLSQRIEVRRTIGPGDFARRYNSWRASAIGPAHTLRQSAFLRGKNVSDKVGTSTSPAPPRCPGSGCQCA